MSYLDRILEATSERVAVEKRERPASALEKEVAGADAPRDFTAALSGPGISLIAEFKRASPSAGPIAGGSSIARMAKAYARGGASAMSVLTDRLFFSGSLEDLAMAKGSAELPVLRKDFIFDEWQVLEARAAGADAVLLIAAAVPDRGLMQALASRIQELGMAALIEVHSEEELEKVIDLGTPLVGINQRDLTTFEVDRGLAVRLRKLIPKGTLVVAESGISSREDVERLEQAEVDAMLVGEHLMRSGDPAAAAAELLGGSR